MAADSERFDGQVVLITGSTRGLGREMASAFAARGASVIVSSRKADACVRAAEEITAQTGVKAVGLPCHVGRWEEVKTLAEAAYREFGRVDVLINNAGISPTYDGLSAVTEALWDKTLDVNVKGAFRLTALVGERMKRAGRGSVINISSVASIRPAADWLPYSIAKAGLNAMTEGFAQGLGPEVRVNAIICGAFLTDIAVGWDDADTSQRMKATTALRRAGRPSEIIGTALYLAGEASSYTTGALLRVDGGRG